MPGESMMIARRYRQRLEHALSSDRLATYAPGKHRDLDTVVNYFWNIALCQALYPSLGTLEVAVRNSIHTTLTDHFGRADWYDIPGLLQSRQARTIRDAKHNIVASRKRVVPGRVVAAVGFGFWTSLLDTLYGNSPKGPQIWRSPNSPLLNNAFPNASGQARGVRRPIFNRLDDIRLLRNRVSHHERISHGIDLPSRGKVQAGATRRVSIVQMHSDILDTIGWVDLVLLGTMRHLDSFDRVYQHGWDDIEREINEYLGLR
jgi:hypothetical protein